MAEVPDQVVEHCQLKEQLQAREDPQVSTTDPDARSMTSDGRATGVVGYNVQAAVDTKHHLIVAHEVTNIGNDRGQLVNMADQARSAMGKTKLEAIADRGYFSGPQIKACEEAGIISYVPKPKTSNSKAAGRFSNGNRVSHRGHHGLVEGPGRAPAGAHARRDTGPFRPGPTERGTRRAEGTTAAAACPRGRRRKSHPPFAGEHPGSLRTVLQSGAGEPLATLPDLTLGLPSEVARRRPDIRAAEARLHNATASIGVARAYLYPSIRIGAHAGVESYLASALTDWGSRAWSIGPSIDLPIFDHGRRKSVVQLRELQQQEAAVAYQRTVLQAWQEIDDALSGYNAERQQQRELAESGKLYGRSWSLRNPDTPRARSTSSLFSMRSVRTCKRAVIL